MRKRVVVVDDEPSTNTLAAEHLRLTGFEVAAFSDARGCLDALEAGLEAHLIVSAYGTPPADFISKVRPEGWLAKPFAPKRLAAEVSRLLGAA